MIVHCDFMLVGGEEVGATRNIGNMTMMLTTVTMTSDEHDDNHEIFDDVLLEPSPTITSGKPNTPSPEHEIGEQMAHPTDILNKSISAIAD